MYTFSHDHLLPLRVGVLSPCRGGAFSHRAFLLVGLMSKAVTASSLIESKVT